MIARIGSAAALCALWLCDALPAVAQVLSSPVVQVDVAAIYNFDPDGATGVPLSCELVRAYLSKPIPRPNRGREEAQASMERRRAAEAARKAMLADETIFAPLWEEQAFELKDGSVRPMTAAEKAILADLEAIDAQNATLTAMERLSYLSAERRDAYAETLCRLIEADVRIAQRSDGYRKVNDDWMWFDWEGGAIVDSRPAGPQAEIALLRYEIARETMGDRFVMMRSAPVLTPTGLILPAPQ